MTQADSVLSTPPTDTSAPDLPPSIELQADLHSHWGPFDAGAAAVRAGHPLANLLRLRQEAANEVERLLAFLDATEGDPDVEPSLTGYSDGMDDREGDDCEDEGAQCDDEGDDEADDDTINEASLGWPERDAQRIWDAVGDHSDNRIGE